MRRELESLLPTLGIVASLVFAGCGPTYPNCDTDQQCHEGEYCVDGHCAECRDDSQCPAGRSCEDHACVPIPGWCASGEDCPPSEVCVSQRCTPRPVSTSTTEPTASTGPEGCQLAPIYFGFDESTLDASARSALAADRACLDERGVTSVSITGMTDPRGTEEYNLALGARRAAVVRDQLRRLGVERRSMSTRSMGEESSTGVDESGWSRDRRAELTPR